MNKILIQYRTHHVLINKNILNHMNRQHLKIETSHSQKKAQLNNPEQTLTPEQKINLNKLKRIMNGEKITLPSKKRWMEKSLDGNKKNKSSTTYQRII